MSRDEELKQDLGAAGPAQGLHQHGHEPGIGFLYGREVENHSSPTRMDQFKGLVIELQHDLIIPRVSAQVNDLGSSQIGCGVSGGGCSISRRGAEIA